MRRAVDVAFGVKGEIVDEEILDEDLRGPRRAVGLDRRLRRLIPNFRRPFKLAPIFATAAIVIAAYNAFLLAVGGPLWGGRVMLTGGIIMLTFVPLYAVRRSADRRRQVATAAAPA